jgi:hypothetical protein
MNRCKETCNSGHDLHVCFEHSSDRAPKRAKTESDFVAEGLDTPLSSLEEEGVAEARFI